jgi:hypothetical protein
VLTKRSSLRVPPKDWGRPAALIASLLVLAACTRSVGQSPTPTGAPTTDTQASSEASGGQRLVALPVSVFATDSTAACAGEALDGPVYLRAEGDRVYGQWGAQNLPLQWPVGFQAVFSPGFAEVLDDDGNVFAKAGDDINSSSDTFHGRHECIGPSGISLW